MGFNLDACPLTGHDRKDGKVSDQFVHDALADVTNGGLPRFDVEHPFYRILNLVLDDPLHINDVQITGKHQGLIGVVRIAKERAGIGGCPIPEGHGLHDLRRYIVAGFDPQGNLGLKAGTYGTIVLAEAKHNRLFSLVDDKETAENQHDEHDCNNNPDNQLRADIVHFSRRPRWLLHGIHNNSCWCRSTRPMYPLSLVSSRSQSWRQCPVCH